MNRRRQTARLALMGMFSAAALVLLFLASTLPSGRMAVSALAGLCVAMALVSSGYGAGIGCYLVSGLLALLFLPNKEVAVYYGAFGLYPIVKLWAEQRRQLLAWTVKLVAANVLLAVGWWLLTRVLGVPLETGQPLVVLWLLGNVVFVCYDVAFTKVMGYLQQRLLPLLRRVQRGR